MTSPASALLTDLYQLTMLQGYLQNGMTETAVFEFFVRELPPDVAFLVAAGLEDLVQYLGQVTFSPEDLRWIEQDGRFSPAFVKSLERFRFTGDVHAIPEGTICFADEPLVRVTAPLPEAQFVESRLITILHYQTLIASKAARCVLAAPGKLVVDFGMRRAHGAEAGLWAARASYLAGFAGTSNVLAAARYGIPAYGTVAHSFIEAHDDEREAFLTFAHAGPKDLALLLDTYDTEAAARKVVSLAPGLRREGIRITAVRLDSGDLAAHARRVRRILNEGGCRDIRIFASGNLDEVSVAGLVRQGIPIDGFGVGTRLATAADRPYLDCAYKLQEYAGQPRRKRSEGKATWPGRKQVRRVMAGDGRMAHDLLTLEDEAPEGEALLVPVMRAGRRLDEPVPLATLRERAGGALAQLPEPLRTLRDAPPYEVRISPGLRALTAQVDRRLGGT